MSKATAPSENASKRKAVMAARLGEAGSEKRVARKKMVRKIYDLLSKTPADKSGLVEGTPFSHAGVVRLMDTLKTRSEKADTAGGKIATSMLKFLAKEGESGKTVNGASVDKLQWLAKMGDKFSK